LDDEQLRLRAFIEPLLAHFKQEIAEKRANGATVDDIEASLRGIEEGMRAIGTISEDKIETFMQIYREAAWPTNPEPAEVGLTDEEKIKAEARRQAETTLGPFFAAIRTAMAEDRSKGMSEAELQRKVSEVCTVIEEKQRCRVPDLVLEEMLLMVKEAALPTQGGPGTK